MKSIKIIKRKPLSKIDISIVSIHLVACLTIWISYKMNLLQFETLKEIIDIYFFMAPLLLIGIYFRKLRNFNFYIIWVIIGVTQLIGYLNLLEIDELNFYKGSALSSLIVLLPIILMFQLFRIIFLKTNKTEIIVSFMKFRRSRWDINEKRNTTLLEVIFSITLVIIAMLIMII
jgi:hypothetical protein